MFESPPLASQTALPARGRHGVSLIVALGLAATLGAWQWEYRSEQQELRREFELRAGNLTRDLRAELARHERILATARTLYAAVPAMTREHWHLLATGLDLPRLYPATVALGFHPRIADAGQGRDSFPLSFIEPATWRNERRLGQEDFDDPAWRRTVEWARDAGDVALTPPLTLARDETEPGGTGFVMMAPLYHGARPADVAARRAAHAGVVTVAFRLADLMRPALTNQFSDLDIHIRCNGQDNLILFDSDPSQPAAAMKLTESIAFGGQLIEVDFHAGPAFIAAHARDSSTMVLFVGPIGTLLIGLLARNMAQARASIERRARRIAADLASTEKRYELAVEAVTDGLWEFDPSAGRLKVSPRYEKLLGYAAGSFAREAINPLHLIHPQDRARVSAMWKTGDTRRQPLTIEFRMHHADGHYLWVRGQGRSMASVDGKVEHLIGTITDVSDLHAALDRLRDLSELASDLFWEQDAQLRFTHLSESADMRENEAFAMPIGKTRWELAHFATASGETQADLNQHRAIVEAHQPFRDFEYCASNLEGEWHWYSVNGKPLFDDAGQFIGYRGTSRDITQRKALEKELRAHRDNLRNLIEAQTIDLVQAKEAAERASHTKSEFLANMSHELRTPLHAILSFAAIGHLRATKATQEKIQEYFARIRDSGGRLLSLLDNLLDLSRLDAGKMAMESRPLDLAALAREVAHDLEAVIEVRHLHLRFAAIDCDTWIVGDHLRLAQVVRNLLANAVKFSAEGCGIEVAFIHDELAAATPGTSQPALRMTIADEGAGIPESELEIIFDKFQQSSRTRTGAGGAGLGLAICREIIAAHGGTLHARNRPGGGAAFETRLPRQKT